MIETENFFCPAGSSFGKTKGWEVTPRGTLSWIRNCGICSPPYYVRHRGRWWGGGGGLRFKNDGVALRAFCKLVPLRALKSKKTIAVPFSV